MNVLAVTGTHAAPRPPAASLRDLLRAWLATPTGRLAVAVVVAFLAYAGWLFSDLWPAHRQRLGSLWNVAFLAGACLACLTTSRRNALEPRLRRAYRIGTVAFFCFGLGHGWWFVVEVLLGQTPPIVTVADVAYLTAYPLLFAALMSFPSEPRTRSETAKLVLDLGAVMLAGSAALWYFVLEPAISRPSITPVETILTVIYPMADLSLLFASAFALLHRPSPGGRGSLAIFGSAGVAFFLTDITYGHFILNGGKYSSGHPIDLGWQLAVAMCLIAPLYQQFRLTRPTTARATVVPSRGVSWLPYAAVAAGLALFVRIAAPVWSAHLMFGLVTIILLTLFVVVRQFLAVRETARLVAERVAGEARFKAMVQNSSDVIAVADQAGTLIFVSPAVGRVFRWRAESLVGQNIASLLHQDDTDGASRFLQNVSNGIAHAPSFVCRMLDGDGNWRHVETMCSTTDDSGTSLLVLNMRDVSERVRLEAELTRRAYNDPLTGLVNRNRFHALVEESQRRRQRRGGQNAVIYLDLDNFKTINDSLGHLQGDHLLTEFAARLLNATRGCDTVSRLGGDEFAVLVEGLSRDEDVIPVVERIKSAMQAPIRLDGTDVVIDASIGIAHARPGVTAEVLLRDADVAMYVAKREGKGRYTIFRPEMQEAVRNHQELESDLRAAIERNEFRVVYQPIVDLHSERIVGAEALLRWEHPSRGLLTPQSFIEPAIESGLIVPIGRFVLQAACAQFAEWRALYPALGDLTISVNVAGRQFQADAFPLHVAAALDASGLPSDRLVLEITESEIMKDTNLTLARLHSLKAIGVRIAIDDFGTGYSSLAYLQRFPVDVLKIDKSFIDNVAFAGHGQSLARMIIALGETMDMRTVAEGIEDRGQVAALQRMRCELAQGYYFAMPLTPHELLARLCAAEALVPDISQGWNDAGTPESPAIAGIAAWSRPREGQPSRRAPQLVA